jgi:hypothetical protein
MPFSRQNEFNFNGLFILLLGVLDTKMAAFSCPAHRSPTIIYCNTNTETPCELAMPHNILNSRYVMFCKINSP